MGNSNLQFTPEKMRELIAKKEWKLLHIPDPPESMRAAKMRDAFLLRMRLLDGYLKNRDLTIVELGEQAKKLKISSEPLSRALAYFHLRKAIYWLMEHGKLVPVQAKKSSRPAA